MTRLKQLYTKVITQLEKGDTNDSVRLPKLVAPFQNALYKKLIELSELIESKEELVYNETYNTKACTNDISAVSPSAMEAKTLVNTSREIRTASKKIRDIEADMKYLEEMISTIKNHSFNLNIYVKGKELVS